MTRRQASRERTRLRLLQSASRLIAKQGYTATSVDAIVEAAGYSKGAFYYNFASKDELFEVLVTQLIDDLVGALEDAMAGAEAIEDKLAAAQVVLAERQPGPGEAELELEVRLSAMRDPKVRTIVADADRRMIAAVADLIKQQYGAAGVEPPMSPASLATAIVAGARGLAVMRATNPEAVPEELPPAILWLVLRPSVLPPDRPASSQDAP